MAGSRLYGGVDDTVDDLATEADTGQQTVTHMSRYVTPPNIIAHLVLLAIGTLLNRPTRFAAM